MVPVQSIFLSVYAPVKTDTATPVIQWLNTFLQGNFAPTHMGWEEKKPVPVNETDLEKLFASRKGGVLSMWRSAREKNEVYLTTTIMPMNALHLQWEKLDETGVTTVLQQVQEVVLQLRPFVWASLAIRWQNVDPGDSLSGQSPLPMEFCKAGPHGAFMVNWFGESMIGDIGVEQLKKLGAVKIQHDCFEINLVPDINTAEPEQVYAAQIKLTTLLRETGFFGDHTYPPGTAGPQWRIPEGMPVKRDPRKK